MELELTSIKDLIIINPDVYQDDRGYFFESYNQSKFHKEGLKYDFIQDNQSFSKRGVIRGLHLQINPFAQAKLIRVLEGEILDVAVDLRKNSPTYGHYESVVLSAENKKQLMIPACFAHGFSVLSDIASVMYKVDKLFDKNSERGIRYDDPSLNIDWKLEPSEIIISEKDLILPFLKDIDFEF